MEALNHLAVVAATLSDLAVGATWYSPLLFYRAWMKANSFSDEAFKKGNPAVVYGLTVLLALVISYNLAFFLADPKTDALWGLTAGFLAGVWAAAGFAIVSLFERRTPAYVFINTGYLLVAFSVKGLIIGAWR
jgi:hypothetical protein